MELSVCHYSYHRTWKEQSWDCRSLAEAVRDLGITAIDFHAGLLGSADEAPGWIAAALEATGLKLSGLSLSNNFNRADKDELEEEIAKTVRWIQVAAEIGAPVSRIFGGHINDRGSWEELSTGLERIVNVLGQVTKEAEKYGVILALENHGGLPCTGEEQVDVIRKINSDNLRATVDIGNYMGCGQEGTEGVAIAAPYAAYVHAKDFKKRKSAKTPWGWETDSCTVGAGVVDVKGCMEILSQAGYKGYVALEYEGKDDEAVGVPESADCVRQALDALS